jgi:hypothetical protein
MHRSDSVKRCDVRTDSWQWKYEKVYKEINRNTRNRDELVHHLNSHAKQSEMEGTDYKAMKNRGFENK